MFNIGGIIEMYRNVNIRNVESPSPFRILQGITDHDFSSGVGKHLRWLKHVKNRNA